MCTCNRDEYNDLYMLAMHADVMAGRPEGVRRMHATLEFYVEWRHVPQNKI